MTSSFGPDSAHRLALDSVLGRLEAAERRIREAEADRLSLLAEAFDIAAAESDRADSSVPRGESAELAYRAVRAEVATALRESERTTERRLEQARALVTDYPRTFAAYRAGRVSERHAAVILEAGAVIGSAGTPNQVLARASYEAGVLPVAVSETPARLRPIARALAEQHAPRSLDERHAEARRGRRVCVIDREDGMAELFAHLPAVEAYAIFDRLTRMSRAITAANTAANTAGIAHGASGANGANGANGATIAAEAPAAGAAAGAARPSDTSAPARSRDEIRADLLSDLLLTAAPSLTPAPTFSPGTGTPGTGGAGTGSPSAGSPGTASAGTGTPAVALGLAAIRGHVQVVLPDIPALPNTQVLPGTPALPDTQALPDTPTLDSRPPTDEPFGSPSPQLPTLLGYGPIGQESARQLAGHAPHWDLVRVQQETGAVLSVDRYRPSEQMRRLLGARDQHCRFPGCRAPLSRCDLDHTIDAAQGGPTSTENLAHLCRGHHTLKHHTAWRVHQNGAGVLDWTSPTGRRYREHPPSRVAFTAAATAGTDPPDDHPFDDHPF